MCDSLFTTHIIYAEKKIEKEKSLEPKRQESERHNSWQQVKHARIYFDLLEAKKREHLIGL